MVSLILIAIVRAKYGFFVHPEIRLLMDDGRAWSAS
jgi:hypothetical protein